MSTQESRPDRAAGPESSAKTTKASLPSVEESGYAFLETLDLLGAPLFVLDMLPPGAPVENLIKNLYRAPVGWPKFTADGNAARLAKAKPGCGYGMVCGHIYDVIDVDPRNGGLISLRELAAANAIPLVRWIVRTAGSGWHIYVDPVHLGKHPGFMPGIDLQSTASFVFIPPTEGYRVFTNV